MLMSVSDKKAAAAPQPAIGCDSNSSKHSDFQSLVCDLHRAGVEPQMPDDLRAITKEDSELRRSDRAIIIALVGPILRKGIPEQCVDGGCKVALKSSGRT